MTKRLEAKSALQRKVESMTAINLDTCMQCGCCTGGCSGLEVMDFSPRQMIQLIKMNEWDIVLKSKTIWMCQSCHICDDRCPAKIKTSAYMDALREIAYKRGSCRENDQTKFHDVFLGQVKQFGRVNEPIMMAQYMLKKPRLPITVKTGAVTGLRGRILPELPHTPSEKYKIVMKNVKEGSKTHGV